MGILNWLFGAGGTNQRTIEDEPFVAPTEKQRRYARKIGLEIEDWMSRKHVSQQISVAEASNPELRWNREPINDQRIIDKYGQAIVDDRDRWNELADEEMWMLVCYMRGQSEYRLIVRINGSSLSDRGKLKILCEEMKIKNVQYCGPLVDVGKYLEIPREKIVWYELVHEVDLDDIKLFRRLEKRLGRVS